MYEFSSYLSKWFKEELEALIFFNPKQGRVVRGVEFGVYRYGRPLIIEENERIRLCLERVDGSQGLFALERLPSFQRVAGAMIYLRTDSETISLVHIAVASDPELKVVSIGASPLFLLIDELKKIGRKINGVRRIELFYGGQKSRYLKV